MATNIPTSPSNRRSSIKRVDILRCNDEGCFGKPCRMIKETLTDYSLFEDLLDETYSKISHLYKENVRRSSCTIFLVCKHTYPLVGQSLKSITDEDICKRCIIASLTQIYKFDKYEANCVHLRNDLSFLTLKKKVEAVIQDDCDETRGEYSSEKLNKNDIIKEGRYISSTQALKSPSSKNIEIGLNTQHSDSTTIYKREIRHGTEPKGDLYEGLSKDDDEEEMYEPLGPSNDSEFLLLRSLSLSDGQNGVHVDSECCTPNKDYNDSIEKLTYNINTGSPVSVVEQIKHIHSRVIRIAEEEKDIHSLVRLLWCDNNGIENRVVEILTEILLHEPINTHNYETLFESVDTLLKIVQKRIASADILLPVVLIMLSVLFQQSLGHPHSHTITDGLKQRHRSYQAIIKDFDDVEQCSVIHKDLTKSIKKILEDIDKKAGKPSNLKLGNWTSALLDDGRLHKLEKELPKQMCFLEQYSCLVRTLVQLNAKLNKKPLEFLMRCVKILVDRYTRKDKYAEQLYPTVQLVAQGIVTVMDKHEYEDRHSEEMVDILNRRLCEVLDLFMSNKKVLIVRRAKLLDDIQKIMFHSNAEVAKNVIKHIENIDLSGASSLVRRTLSHMQYLFCSLSFVTDTINTPKPLHDEPKWHAIHGSILGHEDITLHILLPSKSCLCKGQTENYKVRANKEETSYHENNVEVLRHLSLRKTRPHIIKLFAYQIRPMPFLYAVERLPHHSLSTYLRRQRRKQEWLPIAKLVPMAADIVHAVEFIHQEGVIHRNLMATSFSCRKDGTIVLADFRLAQIIDINKAVKSTGNFVSDVLGSQIPTRWSAPESLLEDRYDTYSDTWMVGNVFYELFTHGCHPYTELYGQNIQDIIEWVIFQDLKLHRWPCIPLAIHELILECCKSNPQDRINLSDIPIRLEQFLAFDRSQRLYVRSTAKAKEGETEKHQSIKRIDSARFRYPELDSRQKNEPERGLPANINGLKKQLGDKRQSYYNTRKSKRKPTVKVAITEGDLSAPDQPVYRSKHYDLEVTEPVTRQFMTDTFPSFQDDIRSLLHIVSKWPPDRQQRETSQHDLTHNLCYRCRNGASLLDLAHTRHYGNPEDNEEKYLEVIKQAVWFVHRMHTHNWILRDICCSNLYRSFTGTEKVFMPRIGRMVNIKEADLTDECLVDRDCKDLFKNRRNWFPVEVLRPNHGHFSKGSDIYMLAMAIYEFYKLTELRPMSSRLEAVPFAKVEREKLLEELHSGEIPEEPDDCPSWLWDELKKCWNRDQTQRPSAESLLKAFDKNMEPSQDEYDEFDGELYTIDQTHPKQSPSPPKDEPPETYFSMELSQDVYEECDEELYTIDQTHPKQSPTLPKDEPPALPSKNPPSRKKTPDKYINGNVLYSQSIKALKPEKENSHIFKSTHKEPGTATTLPKQITESAHSNIEDEYGDTASIASSMSFANLTEFGEPNEEQGAKPKMPSFRQALQHRSPSIKSNDSKLSFANSTISDRSSYDYPYELPLGNNSSKRGLSVISRNSDANNSGQNATKNENNTYLDLDNGCKEACQQTVTVRDIGDENIDMPETPVYQEFGSKIDEPKAGKKPKKERNVKKKITRQAPTDNALYESSESHMIRDSGDEASDREVFV